ncbi:terpene synthase [Nostoc sp. LEGE 12447]|uniref:terpene synthase family protein n=1 Tax=Nostoc sp. LEGE 12447 TaxID=1828640 RepID=UPI0018835566|nr:terpene synthase [Nostoc sp. LEGE 12447]MBE8999789.1 terpene synthase [Nostoc sp. LEGE 12447]
MNQLLSHDLYCPFPSLMNKYVDVLEEYSLEWVLRFKLLPDKSSFQRFCKAKFFLLAASTYPSCQLEELKIANDLLSWLFIWDDQCDLSDLRKQPERLKGFHDIFLGILNGKELTNQDVPLAHALSNLRHRILERGNTKWFHHFLCSFKGYFQGCVEEATNRIQGVVPDIDTYMAIRILAGGVEPVIELIEFCDHLIISDFVREHDIVKELKLKANKVLCWGNDIFSALREMEDGDVHNLVLVLHYQENLPLVQAINRAAEIHDQDVLNMMNLEASIPNFGEEEDAELAKYISGLHSWISANLAWCAQSTRYHTAEKLEVIKC